MKDASGKLALCALRVVADWFSVFLRGQLPFAKYELITSSTADEEYMVSVCLQKISTMTVGCKVILLDASSCHRCDYQRVSALLQLTGYVNRITTDEYWISIALFPTFDPCYPDMQLSVQYLKNISRVVNNQTAISLCAQITRMRRINEIFACAFCLDHEQLSVILRGVSSLPFRVSTAISVNFVLVAWLIEARGYSVWYRYGDTQCIVDAPGVYPACSTWCRLDERLSLYLNKPRRALGIQ